MTGENPSPTSDQEVSFAKTRFDYSSKMFEREVSRKATLETKAQFYLTLYTAFVTAIFFSLPFLTVLQGFMNNARVGQVGRIIITILLIALGLALVLSLITVLFAMRIRDYTTEYPSEPYSSLFVPNDANFKENNEAEFLTFTAQSMILALEDNKAFNDEKAKWVERASYGVLVSVLLLAILVGISVYLQVYIVLPTPSKP